MWVWNFPLDLMSKGKKSFDFDFLVVNVGGNPQNNNKTVIIFAVLCAICLGE